jgi:hypothetical protein
MNGLKAMAATLAVICGIFLLMTLGYMVGEDERKQGTDLTMKCTEVGRTMIYIGRCENTEAVCYFSQYEKTKSNLTCFPRR